LVGKFLWVKFAQEGTIYLIFRINLETFVRQEKVENFFWYVSKLFLVTDVPEVLADERKGCVLEEEAVVVGCKTVNSDGIGCVKLAN
jgi:hypothetical protein